MPSSFAHEAPRELCEAFPDLVPCLLRDLLHVDLPPFSGLRLEDSNFTQASPKEFRADAALVLGAGEPAAGVIFEIQSAIDLLKRFSWPLYLAALHARLRCPCYLLVLALDPRTARWAAESITTFQPGARFRPLVIGPDELPAITDLLQAQANPALAALSALLHASDPDPEEVIVTAMAAVHHGYGPERALWLLNVLRPLVDDAILTRLEELLMQDQPWFPRTEFEKLHYGRGKSDGKSEGMAKGMAKSILRIFAGRQVQVDEETQRRLLACTDEELLSELIDRALTATVAADLFRDC